MVEIYGIIIIVAVVGLKLYYDHLQEKKEAKKNKNNNTNGKNKQPRKRKDNKTL